MLSSADFHKEFLPFKIHTHEIALNGLRFSRLVSKAALDALLFEPHNADFSWVANQDATVSFHLERENDHSFLVHVQTSLVLSSPCARCLDPVKQILPLDFSIRMLDQKHLGISMEEAGEWQFDSLEEGLGSDDEGAVGYFSKDCIDLGIILRDQIFFLVPDYPQCDAKSRDVICGKDSSLVLANQDFNHSNPFLKLVKKN